MSISDRLDEIQERADNATDGPWEKRAVRGWEMVVSYATEEMIQLVAEFRHEERDVADAEFIAHSRTDVPELVEAVRRRDAALRAVLDLHAEIWHDGPRCNECSEPELDEPAEYPCPAARAVEAALGEEV